MIRLALILLLQLLALHAVAAPSQADLRAAEKLAEAFVAGRDSELVGWFSAPLKASLPTDRLARQRDGLTRSIGKTRFVQAAWPESAPAMGAVVPIDHERGNVDLRVQWSPGPLEKGTVVGFSFAARRPRPTPAAARRNQPQAPVSWVDARYVDRSRFTSESWAIEPALAHPRPATLCLPNGTELVPAVVLIPEWDAADADGARGPNKMMRDLGEGLASRGIATLRLEPGPWQDAHDADRHTLTHADEALRRLAVTAGIDPARVYIVGHDLGAVMALELAHRLPRLRGVVLLSPVAIYTPALELRRRLAEVDAGLLGPQAVEPMRLLLPGYESGMMLDDESFGSARAGFWRDLAPMAPARRLATVPVHTLALVGSRDYLLRPDEVDALRAAAAMNPRAWVLVEEGLNRWMMETDAATSRDAVRPAHVSEQAIATIVRFVETDGLRGR